jgi:hypothetical protein
MGGALIPNHNICTIRKKMPGRGETGKREEVENLILGDVYVEIIVRYIVLHNVRDFFCESEGYVISSTVRFSAVQCCLSVFWD